MMILIVSIIMSLAVLLSAFINFTPNLHAVIQDDFNRQVYSNAALYSLQYGQLTLRAKTLVENDTITFSPRGNCTGPCPVPSPTAGEFLTEENGVPKSRLYTQIAYKKLSGTDPAPVLQITPTIAKY